MLVLRWCGLRRLRRASRLVSFLGDGRRRLAELSLEDKIVWDATGFRVPGRVDKVWGRGPFLLVNLVSLQPDGAKISWYTRCRRQMSLWEH